MHDRRPKSAVKRLQSPQVMRDGFRLAMESLDNGTRVLVIEGELDMATASEFESALETAFAGSAPVVVDLTGCSFLDSTALNVLVRAHRRGEGRRLSLVVPESSDVLRVFEVTQLDRVLDVQPTRAAAKPHAIAEVQAKQHVREEQ